MSDPVDALVLDLLEWIGAEPRSYAEVIEAWRTSCPRLPVWEEANARGFLAQEHREGAGAFVSVTPAGREWLARHRTSRAPTLERASIR
jgi:hypothetical protein